LKDFFYAPINLRQSMKKIFLLSAVALLIGVLQSQARYQVGDLVADFTLPDSQGNPVSLYDYSDEIVVIYFWSST